MRIYLDHNATTPLCPAVYDEMTVVLREVHGSPSSIHREGQRARRVLDRARLRVARALGAQPEEIVFTSGGTESVSLALRGAAGSSPGDLVVSAVEHKAVANTCRALLSEGFRVETLPVDAGGRVDPEQAAAALGDATRLVSVMLANNVVGSLQPVEVIAARARERGVVSHTDAVQALGKIPLRVRELGVDLLSVSAHKLGGPRGVGALYVRRGTRLAAQLHGGPQERRRRAGTENLAGIAGFGMACAILDEELDARSAHLRSLRDDFEERVRAAIGGVEVNGDLRARLPNTSNLTFEGQDAESLLMNLDLRGVAASAGSACSAESHEPSRVLLAMGWTEEQARSSLRFSFGPGNTREEVERAVGILSELVEQARSGGGRRG